MILRRRGSHRRRLLGTETTDTATLAAINPNTGPAYKAAKDKTRNRRSVAVGAAAAVLTLLLTLNALSTGSEKENVEQQKQAVEQQRDEAVAQKLTLAEQITIECKAGRLAGPVCSTAAEAKSEPPNVPPLPTAGELSTAVRDYLAAHPPPAGREPTTQEIAAAVTAYLTDNPPEPGRAPTSGEIEAAVALYYAANPPPQGEPGGRGEPGPPPTTEEIAAAVAAYLQANPPPAGRDGGQGEPGAAGVGIRSVSDPSRGDNGCVITFELTDNTSRAVVIPDEFCGTPPPDEEPPAAEGDGSES